MKLVIFTNGLTVDELKALDRKYASLQMARTPKFFEHYSKEAKAIFVYVNPDGVPKELAHGGEEYARLKLKQEPEVYRLAEVKFEKTVVAEVIASPPLYVKAHGRRYKLIPE